MRGVLLGGATSLVPVMDVIDTAKALQEHLAIMATDSHQLETAAMGIEQILDDPRKIYGARHLAIAAAMAVVQRDYHTTCSEDEVLFNGLALTDVRLRAEFGRFAFLRRGKMLSSLTLQLFSAEILAANEEPYVNSVITSGVHVPVMAVRSVFPLE